MGVATTSRVPRGGTPEELGSDVVMACRADGVHGQGSPLASKALRKSSTFGPPGPKRIETTSKRRLRWPARLRITQSVAAATTRRALAGVTEAAGLP